MKVPETENEGPKRERADSRIAILCWHFHKLHKNKSVKGRHGGKAVHPLLQQREPNVKQNYQRARAAIDEGSSRRNGTKFNGGSAGDIKQ